MSIGLAVVDIPITASGQRRSLFVVFFIVFVDLPGFAIPLPVVCRCSDSRGRRPILLSVFSLLVTVSGLVKTTDRAGG